MTSVTTDKTVFHNTSDLQDWDSETVGLRTRPVWDQKNRSWSWSRPIFLVSNRSCPKTDGLRPLHR